MKPAILTVALIVALGCHSNTDHDAQHTSTAARTTTMSEGTQHLSRGDLELVAEATVYFGHQSVGFNILDGVVDLAAEEGINNLNIVESRDLGTQPSPGFFHAQIGENTRPKMKIDAFASDIRGMQDALPDLALMKLCYVDINPNTNIDDLFSHYQNTIDALKQEHPHITFVHSTVPLTTVSWKPRGIKGLLLKLLGRIPDVDPTMALSNVNRQEFNQRLLEAYAADPVFDLSRAESTRLDGSRVTFVHDGTEHFSLDDSYTYDGGHLNELGRRWVAADMVRALAAAVRDRRNEGNQ